MGDPERIDAILLRRSHWVRHIGFATWVVGGVLALANVGQNFLVLFTAGTTGMFLVIFGEQGHLRRVSASIDKSGIVVDDAIVARRESLQTGWVERTADVCVVHLER